MMSFTADWGITHKPSQISKAAETFSEVYHSINKQKTAIEILALEKISSTFQEPIFELKCLSASFISVAGTWTMCFGPMVGFIAAGATISTILLHGRYFGYVDLFNPVHLPTLSDIYKKTQADIKKLEEKEEQLKTIEQSFLSLKKVLAEERSDVKCHDVLTVVEKMMVNEALAKLAIY